MMLEYRSNWGFLGSLASGVIACDTSDTRSSMYTDTNTCIQTPSHTEAVTHTHTHPHSHSHSRSLTLTLTHSHSRTLTLTHSHTHTHTHTPVTAAGASPVTSIMSLSVSSLRHVGQAFCWFRPLRRWLHSNPCVYVCVI